MVLNSDFQNERAARKSPPPDTSMSGISAAGFPTADDPSGASHEAPLPWLSNRFPKDTVAQGQMCVNSVNATCSVELPLCAFLASISASRHADGRLSGRRRGPRNYRGRRPVFRCAACRQDRRTQERNPPHGSRPTARHTAPETANAERALDPTPLWLARFQLKRCAESGIATHPNAGRCEDRDAVAPALAGARQTAVR